METSTETSPAPPVNLIDQLRAIDAGSSALFERSDRMLNSVRSTLTRIKRESPGLEFTTRMTDEGVRVWRLS